MQELLQARAEGSGRAFASVGVAMDWSIEDGVRFLEETTVFDEITVGRNWMNSAVVDLILSDASVVPGVPHLAVFERYVSMPTEERLVVGEKRILHRAWSADDIEAWVDAGAPILDESEDR